MRERIWTALLVLILVFYCVLAVWKGVDAIREGGVVAILLGLALIVSAGLAIGLSWREVAFGRSTATLARELASEGGVPVDDLPRRPSGRVDRSAADVVFEERRAETEADPDNWRTWYRLGMAYDAAGDRTRAREAVRHAIALHDSLRG